MGGVPLTRAAGERGSVLVIFAVGIPTLILFLAMALDIGNWYVHKRALQNRIDASVEAASVEYGTLFPECTTTPALASQITSAATQYAGTTGTFNRDIHDPSKLTLLVNDGANDPCVSHAADEFSPQGGYWLDVKARETNIVSFFGGLGITPSVSAQARVALEQLTTSVGAKPFVARDTSAITCDTAELKAPNDADTDPPFATIALDQAGTGTVNVDMPANDLRLDVLCGSSGQTPVRYRHLGYIDSYVPGDPPPFTLQGVELILNPSPPAGLDCAPNGNPYFIAHDGNPCQIGVTATVRLPPSSAFTVIATIGNTDVELFQDGVTNTWRSNSFVTVNPQVGNAGVNGPDGKVRVWLSRRPPPPPSDPAPFEPPAPPDPAELHQQQIQAGTSLEQGPIQNVTISDTTIEQGATNVPITVTVTMRSQALTDALRSLDAIDCVTPASPTAVNAVATVIPGCGPMTAGTSQVGKITDLGSGTNLADLQQQYNELWAPGGTCSTDNWPGAGGATSSIPRNDPRLITIFLSADDLTGAGPFTVTGHAGFYVTGWDGSSCSGATAAPQGGISGHLVKFVNPSSGGAGNGGACDPADLYACIATLVR
jgi:Flp pilus assembly protein TadG